MLSIATFIILFIGWILLSGKLDMFHLTLGAISCLIVTHVSGDLLFQDRKKSLGVRITEGYHFLLYCIWLFWQIVKANFHVIGLALSPKRTEESLDPHIFTFTTSLKTEFARFVLANSITLTSGTVTIRVHNDSFYIHAISVEAAGDLVENGSMSEMEKRIAHVFERGNGDD